MHKPNFNRYVALNLIQGRTGVRFCDADTIGVNYLKQGCYRRAVRPFFTKNKFSEKEGNQVQPDKINLMTRDYVIPKH